MPRKYTLQQFKDKGNIVHDFKYDYSKFIYVNSRTKGIIICPLTDKFGNVHGEFRQTPKLHLIGQECCKICAKIHISKVKTFTNQEFIDRANEVHDNKKYNYSKSVYNGQLIKLIIICNEINVLGEMHGEFKQTPKDHIAGHGCKKCKDDNLRMKKDDFINKGNLIHYNKYDYSKFVLYNFYTEGIIICPVLNKYGEIHGEFNQTPESHLKGSGCQKCGGCARMTCEEFIREADGIYNNKYDYSEYILINSKTEGKIICPKHGEFYRTPNHHLTGASCNLCGISNKRINENLVRAFLKRNNIEFSRILVKLSVNKPGRHARPDIYVNSLNLIIEYNGPHHYQPTQYGGMTLKKADEKFKYQQLRDQQLKQYCTENNINLLEIDGIKYQGKKLTKFLEEYFKTTDIYNNTSEISN